MAEENVPRKTLRLDEPSEITPVVNEDSNYKPSFEDLPLQLYSEIFKHLSIRELNLIRLVCPCWDVVIKCDFGTRIALCNWNLNSVCSADSYLEIQVLNLTRPLCPSSHRFTNPQDLRRLEIIGMILSSNLLFLLQQFPKLQTLKVSRVYLETDQRLIISAEASSAFSKSIKQLEMRYLKTFRHLPPVTNGPFRQQRFSHIFGVAPSDQLIISALSFLQLSQLTVIHIYHDIGQDHVRDLRNGDMIHWGESAEHLNELQADEMIKALCKLLRKVFVTAINLKDVRVDNAPALLPDIHSVGSEPPLEDDQEVDFNHLNLEVLRLEGAFSRGWEPVLNSVCCLTELYLVPLGAGMVPVVKNAVRRCAGTLQRLSLIFSTMHNIVTQHEPEGGDLQEEFDCSFLLRCTGLKGLELKCASKRIQATALPTWVSSLSLCADVYDVHEYMSQSPGLTHLRLEISKGFFTALPLDENDRPEVFSCKENLVKLVANYGLRKLDVTEYGAIFDHRDMQKLCRKLQDAGFRVSLRHKVCKLRRIHEQEEQLQIPNIVVELAEGFDKSKLLK